MIERTSVGDISSCERARQSGGISNDAIYQMVAQSLKSRSSGGVLVDVGCGVGHLWPFVRENFREYIGVDAVRYDEFPTEAQFCYANFDVCPTSLRDACADVVAAVEIIEHLENPRAFMRELVRLAKPGGWIVVTTPNQESFLSLLTLVLKRRFSAFQDVDYPAHLTPLLEADLRRIASECNLLDVSINYSQQGRIALTPRHYPEMFARFFPRALSDNVMVLGNKPRD